MARVRHAHAEVLELGDVGPHHRRPARVDLLAHPAPALVRVVGLAHVEPEPEVLGDVALERRRSAPRGTPAGTSAAARGRGTRGRRRARTPRPRSAARRRSRARGARAGRAARPSRSGRPAGAGTPAASAIRSASGATLARARAERRPSPRAIIRAMRAAELDTLVTGSGPRVVLVHGSIVGAERTWRHQLALAERWTLVVANRPGFGASPAARARRLRGRGAAVRRAARRRRAPRRPLLRRRHRPARRRAAPRRGAVADRVRARVARRRRGAGRRSTR